MERRKLVVGNWKMELSHAASVELARALKQLLASVPGDGIDVVICPSFVQLAAVAEEMKDYPHVAVGTQNVHFVERGAWTGEVSVHQIKHVATLSIVGHSERRRLTGETDAQIRDKALLLLKNKLTPVVCLGESAEEKERGQTVKKVTEQALAILDGVRMADLARLVIAYEPIWAIGTGQICEPRDAASTMLLVRKLAADRFGREAADRLRIIYGGSVLADNAEECMKEPGIDGVLVGGASVHPGDFVAIVKIVQEAVI